MVSGLALEQLKAINTLQDVDLKFASYYCSAFWGPISIYSFGCGTESCAFDSERFHRHCFSSYQVSYRIWHRTCWTWEELVRYPNHLLSHFTQLYQVSPPNYCFEWEPKRQGHLSRVWIRLPLPTVAPNLLPHHFHSESSLGLLAAAITAYSFSFFYCW